MPSSSTHPLHRLWTSLGASELSQGWEEFPTATRHPEAPHPNILPKIPVENNPAALPQDSWGSEAVGTHQDHGVVGLLQLRHCHVPPHGDVPVVGTALRSRRLREGVGHVLQRAQTCSYVPQPGPRPAADRRSLCPSPPALRCCTASSQSSYSETLIYQRPEITRREISTAVTWHSLSTTLCERKSLYFAPTWGGQDLSSTFSPSE